MNNTRKSFGLIVGLLAILPAFYSRAADTNLTERIRSIYREPCGFEVTERWVAQLVKEGFTTNMIEDNLIGQIRDIVSIGKDNQSLDGAIWLLSEICDEKGISFLKQLASTNGPCRDDAVIALVHIGGTNLLPFAKDIFESKTCTDTEKSQVFEMLRNCYLADEDKTQAMTPEPFASSLLDLLIGWVAVEPADERFRYEDQGLAKVSESYRDSYERKDLLAKHIAALDGRTDDYAIRNTKSFQQTIDGIKSIPAGKMIHIKIKTLSEVCNELKTEDSHVSYLKLRKRVVVTEKPAIQE